PARATAYHPEKLPMIEAGKAGSVVIFDATRATKLPKVGTTIFPVMSQLAVEHQAVNLGQGFPDFSVPEFLVESLARAMREGKNQYAPMTGIPALRQAIAAKTLRCYGRQV